MFVIQIFQIFQTGYGCTNAAFRHTHALRAKSDSSWLQPLPGGIPLAQQRNATPSSETSVSDTLRDLEKRRDGEPT